MTLFLAIGSGVIAGFLTSKIPMPEKQFDDTFNFVHVTYGDGDVAQYNERQQVLFDGSDSQRNHIDGINSDSQSK